MQLFSLRGTVMPLVVCLLFSINAVYSQVAVTATNTTYLTATSGSSYSATGAPLSPIAGNTYTYNYGALSGNTNNSRQLNSFTAGGNNFSFISIPGQFVRIRRVNNAQVTGTRSLRYSEGTIAGNTVNINNEYNDDMEVFFNGNTNFNSGSDNLFANQGDGNGNNNNIERLDVIFPNGMSATDNSRLGFCIFERGDVNAHDPIKVAIILSVNAAGTPTTYSNIINITAANYGTANPVANSEYVIMRRDVASETVMKASTTSTQGVGGVFIRLSDFGLANNTMIYGYSIIPNDFTGSTSADIVNYTNATLYPTTTSGATGSGGIDLVSSTGAFQSGNVINGGIYGRVFNDVNGLTNNLVDGTGTNVGGSINAILVNTLGNVVANTLVNPDGSYTFGMIPAGSYNLRISRTPGVLGTPAPAVLLPAGWATTGEGTLATGDGNADGITNTFVFSGTTLTGVNFGIEQTPTATSLSATSQVNPGGTTSVTVPPTTFAASDVAGGTITSLRISAFPANATSITINGIIYVAATFPVTGVTIPANAAGQPTQVISIDPVDGAVISTITYYAIDNAAKESALAATASIPFTALNVSGNIYNDVNGLSNGLVDGTGTNAGGLTATLVNNTGNVVANATVSASGAYLFTNVSGGTYTVRISTLTGTVGSAAPAVVLPSGWVNTGEGTTTAGDGTVNGITNTFTLTSANITNVNFGIEQPPTAFNLTAAPQENPGSTFNATVPATTFGGTEFNGGTINSLRITAFPSNATSITINGIAYTATSFPGTGVTIPTNASGQPTQTVLVDPVGGAFTVAIPYVLVDNAGKESVAAGSANIPFNASLCLAGTNIITWQGATSGSRTVVPSFTTAGGPPSAITDTTSGCNGENIFTLTVTDPNNIYDRIRSGTNGTHPNSYGQPYYTVTLDNFDGGCTGCNASNNAAYAPGTRVTVTIKFRYPVIMRNFRVDDIDAADNANPPNGSSSYQDQLTFYATDINGANVPVSLSVGAAGRINISGQTATAVWASGANNNLSADDPLSQVTASTGIAVKTFVMEFIAGPNELNPAQQAVRIGQFSVCCPEIANISGNVFNDLNGLTDNTVNGNTTLPGTTSYANLVNPVTNTVVDVVAVNGSGAYAFTASANKNYSIILSTTQGIIDNTAPAASLPSGWVHTGENIGTGTGNDGMANGVIAVALGTTSIANVNFGIEQTPTASALIAPSRVNPGATTSANVPAATFGAADFGGGTITSIRISSFPTNTNAVTINGTSYTAANFPLTGVTIPTNASGQPTQTIAIDPIDGAITSVITYYAVDNAAKESQTTGTASVPFTTVSVSGNVFNDVNGLNNSLIDGTLTNAGGTLYASIVNSGNAVIGTVAISAGGSYVFNNINGGSYSVVLHISAGGSAIPALPSGWTNTGEGTAGAGDGTVNGITNFSVSTANITGVNFGIEQLPTPLNASAASRVNPGGAVSVSVPAVTFGATDPSGGSITSIRISTFPSNVTSITINGTLYTNTTFPSGGVTVPTNGAGQPIQPISIDPIDGAVTAVITFYAVDNATKESATTGTASIPFTTVSVSGTVYNDVNGLSNGLIDGTGTNAGGTLYASLLNSSNTVIITSAVNASGVYQFNNVNSGNYTVVLHTTAAGSNVPTVPSGYVNTAEGTTTSGDGTANGVTAIAVASTNIVNVNFGIEQPAIASNLTAPTQTNPGGTTSVTVPASTFGATDFNGGTIISIRINSFPTNATSITINGVNYTSANFPVTGIIVPTNGAGQPTQQISIDPIDGPVSSVISYYATDNAGFESSANGTASVPFACAIPGLWTGSIDNNWHNPANWCSLTAPMPGTDVVIPSGTTNIPVISSPVVIRNINLQTGTSIDIRGNSFTIGGTITGTGTFTTNATTSLTVTGSGTGTAGTLYFTNGNNNLGTLTITQTGPNGEVNIGSPLNIITTVNVTNGTLNTNNNVTLVSNATGTASVEKINCAIAAINGNLTVERYISARRAWRLLGVPVGGNQTINQAWQEGATSVTQNPRPGYGTHITGGTAANGFDQTLTNNPSIRIYNQPLFSFTSTPLTSTNQPLNNEQGYFLLVRGDRSLDLSTNTPTPTPTVLRTTGPLRSCTQNYPTIQGVCNFIGNPYPSSIDFTKLGRVNIPNRFFLWDPYLNSVGGYQTFDSSNNWVPVPGGGSYGNVPNTIIQSGQAFFVQGTIANGSLTIDEDAKVTGATNNTFFRPSSIPQKLAITLNTVNSNGTVNTNDGVMAIFDDRYAASFDNDDARKMTNVDEIFSLIRENKLLSIEKRPTITVNDTLFIKAYRLKVKNYELKIMPQYFNGTVTAYLQDIFLQSSVPLDLLNETTYRFTVTADSNSSISSRFRIVFRPATVLPLEFISVTATEAFSHVKVTWIASGTASVVKFEVEKSIDGQLYTNAGTIAPSNTQAYQWTDEEVSTSNYYRIKAIESSGRVYYSDIVFIKKQSPKPLLTVYPNPIMGGRFTYAVSTMPPGMYTVQLFNETGQVVYTDKIMMPDGGLRKTVYIMNGLSKGVYRLTLTNEKNRISKTINHN